MHNKISQHNFQLIFLLQFLFDTTAAWSRFNWRSSQRAHTQTKAWTTKPCYATDIFYFLLQYSNSMANELKAIRPKFEAGDDDNMAFAACGDLSRSCLLSIIKLRSQQDTKQHSQLSHRKWKSINFLCLVFAECVDGKIENKLQIGWKSRRAKTSRSDFSAHLSTKAIYFRNLFFFARNLQPHTPELSSKTPPSKHINPLVNPIFLISFDDQFFCRSCFDFFFGFSLQNFLLYGDLFSRYTISFKPQLATQISTSFEYK